MDPPPQGFHFPSPSPLQGLFHDQHAVDINTGLIDWNTVLSGQLGFRSIGVDHNRHKLHVGMDPVMIINNHQEGEKLVDEAKNKGKGGKCTSSKVRKATRPRFAFQTRSPNDILDDGYRWRKYGQKAVKNSSYPRSYYRCTHHTCDVKKQVQRLSKDTSIVVTTYEGIHNHPCEKVMETLTPLLKQMRFLTRF